MSTNSSLEQAAHILTLIGQKKLPMSDLQKFINGGFLSDLLEANPERIDRDGLRVLLGLFPLKPRIVVDYSVPLEELMRICDWVDPVITSEQFPENKTGTEECIVDSAHFSHHMLGPNMLWHFFKEQGGHAATVRELLVFVAAFPRVQCAFPIVALGSPCVIHRSKFFPCLSFHEERGRMLHLADQGRNWLPGTIFPFCSPVKVVR